LDFSSLYSLLKRIVELDYQLMEFSGVLFFSDAIAKSSDFVLFLGGHGD
jgi:hypothetical protein